MMTYSKFLQSKSSKGLNEGQLLFFKDFCDSNRNLFLTGGAGVGKSFVLNRLSEFCEEEGILLSKTSSTGVSAININAQTLHSFLGIGLADCPIDILVKKVHKNKAAKSRIKKCKILFIDEISMISGELLDKVYAVIKELNWNFPRIICVGDALQLPPVFRSDSTFFFESKAWKTLNPKIINLTEIVRQDKESEFAKILGKIRLGDKTDLALLQSRIITGDPPKGSMVVFSKNVDVDFYNNSELSKIKGNESCYEAIESGPSNLLESIDKNCLAPRQLRLKVGAQVMLLKNNSENRLSNGSIGKVTSLGPAAVEVEFESGVYTISKEDWKIEESFITIEGKVKTRTLACRTQIPLRLSYAATVHKVQGFTIDKITVDVSNCFSPGQCYVALSRAKSIDGLHIKGLSPSSIKVDPKCIEFYKNL